MLYVSFLAKAIDDVIVEADNGLCYLEPMWKTVLCDNGLDIKDVSDVKVEWSDVEDVLKLNVEKRNTENSLKPYVLNWIHDIITASIEPAVLQEETDYIKNLTEYLKTNKDMKLKEEEWEKFKES